MQAELWKRCILEDMFHRLGHRVDIVEEIFSTYSQDILRTKFTSHQLMRIATNLKIPLEELGITPIDWDAVISDYLLREYSVPEEYTLLAGTHMSTIRSFIQFFNSRFTNQATQALLQRLDFHGDILMNDHIKVNNHFLNRILAIMTEEYGLDLEDLDAMSLVTHRYSSRNSVIRMVSSCHSDREILETMVSNASKYELNNSYSIEHYGDNSIVSSVSRYPALGRRNEKTIMGPQLMHFKVSTLKNITFILGRSPLAVSFCENTFQRGHQVLRFKISDTNQLRSFRNKFFH